MLIPHILLQCSSCCGGITLQSKCQGNAEQSTQQLNKQFRSMLSDWQQIRLAVRDFWMWNWIVANWKPWWRPFPWELNGVSFTKKKNYLIIPECLEIGQREEHRWPPDSKRPGPGLALLHPPDRVWSPAIQPVQSGHFQPLQAGEPRALPAALENAAGHQHATWYPHRLVWRYKHNHSC